jgi:bacteriocin biosynthesis cyclodehydratase domain-containing protein
MPPGTGDSRRPRLAFPFTILASPGTVRLVAGEDFRYTLSADGLDQWLPKLLASLNGRRTQAEALAGISEAHRKAAAGILDRLARERVLVQGGAAEAHPARAYQLAVEGKGALLEGLTSTEAGAPPLPILCQDRLDYEEALQFNRRCLDGDGPWMWASYGPMARGYVSPVFLPASGPCLACLILHFRRRSPAPEIYDALMAPGRGSIEPVPFPAEGFAILRAVILRKIALLAEAAAPAAPYRLHVLEGATFEVSSHRVYRDPECEACGRRRR